MVNLNFKNIDKMLPENVIKKMRQEDLRQFLLTKRKHMTTKEADQFTKKMLYQGADSYPSGNEFLVERSGNKLCFNRFE